MYTKTYPSLNPVVDPVARQRLVQATAPPVLAGSAIDDELLLCAIMERQLREIEAQHGILTRREVLAAVIREHAIKSEHAAAEYPSVFAATITPGV